MHIGNKFAYKYLSFNTKVLIIVKWYPFQLLQSTHVKDQDCISLYGKLKIF